MSSNNKAKHVPGPHDTAVTANTSIFGNSQVLAMNPEVAALHAPQAQPPIFGNSQVLGIRPSYKPETPEFVPPRMPSPVRGPPDAPPAGDKVVALKPSLVDTRLAILAMVQAGTAKSAKRAVSAIESIKEETIEEEAQLAGIDRHKSASGEGHSFEVGSLTERVAAANIADGKDTRAFSKDATKTNHGQGNDNGVDVSDKENSSHGSLFDIKVKASKPEPAISKPSDDLLELTQPAGTSQAPKKRLMQDATSFMAAANEVDTVAKKFTDSGKGKTPEKVTHPMPAFGGGELNASGFKSADEIIDEGKGGGADADEIIDRGKGGDLVDKSNNVKEEVIKSTEVADVPIEEPKVETKPTKARSKKSSKKGKYKWWNYKERLIISNFDGLQPNEVNWGEDDDMFDACVKPRIPDSDAQVLTQWFPAERADGRRCFVCEFGHGPWKFVGGALAGPL